MRNTRLDYKGKLPLAKLELNDNKQFINTIKQQEVFNAVTIESEWDAVQGAKDDQLLKIRVVVNGAEKALKLTDIKIDLSETSHLSSIDRLHIYYAGQTPRSTERKTD
ncbi:BNR-repeat neuraminidase N-terminal domain-containing protein [Sphingobacterium siyangense]